MIFFLRDCGTIEDMDVFVNGYSQITTPSQSQAAHITHSFETDHLTYSIAPAAASTVAIAISAISTVTTAVSAAPAVIAPVA